MRSLLFALTPRIFLRVVLRMSSHPAKKGALLMELLTEELKRELPPLYSQEHEKDPLVYAKFFHPLASMTWYAIEGSPAGDDFIFFGWVYSDFPELGYFSLNEIQAVQV